MIGLGAFYYALSRGTMGVIAPLAALIGAGVPVMVSVAGGESVPPARLLGIALALVAVVLTSLPGGESDDSERRRVRVELHELPLIVVCRAGFCRLLPLRRSGHDRWRDMVAAVRGSHRGRDGRTGRAARACPSCVPNARHRPGYGLASSAWAVCARSNLPAGRLIALLLLTGLADLGGNVFFLLAKETDALSVAVVLSSLYPVVTTILAAIFLHERLRRTQIAGVALATVSVPLMR